MTQVIQNFFLKICVQVACHGTRGWKQLTQNKFYGRIRIPWR